MEKVRNLGLDLPESSFPQSAKAVVKAEAIPESSDLTDEVNVDGPLMTVASLVAPPTLSASASTSAAVEPEHRFSETVSPRAIYASRPASSPPQWVPMGGEVALGNGAGEIVAQPFEMKKSQDVLSSPLAPPVETQPKSGMVASEESPRATPWPDRDGFAKVDGPPAGASNASDGAVGKRARREGNQNPMPDLRERIVGAAATSAPETESAHSVRAEPNAESTNAEPGLRRSIRPADDSYAQGRGAKTTASAKLEEGVYFRADETPVRSGNVPAHQEPGVKATQESAPAPTDPASDRLSSVPFAVYGPGPKIGSIKVLENQTLASAPTDGLPTSSIALVATQRGRTGGAVDHDASVSDGTVTTPAVVRLHFVTKAPSGPDGETPEFDERVLATEFAAQGIEPTRTDNLPLRTGPVVAAQSHAGANFPHEIHARLAELARHHAGQTIEIALSPEELGRVRMSFSTHDGGLAMTIQADRPETLDLMRRHIESLAEDFRDLGFQDLSFAFGNDQSADKSHEQNGSDDLGSSDATDPITPRTPPDQTLRGTLAVDPDNRLDLRL
jgi:hypothetical protein